MAPPSSSRERVMYQFIIITQYYIDIMREALADMDLKCVQDQLEEQTLLKEEKNLGIIK